MSPDGDSVATSTDAVQNCGAHVKNRLLFSRRRAQGEIKMAGVTAPTISTEAAAMVSNNAALLTMVMDDGNTACDIWFDFGTNPDLSNSMQVGHTQTTGVGPQNANGSVTGLSASTTYYFRGNATSLAGTGQGGVASFVTAQAAPPQQPDISIQTVEQQIMNNQIGILVSYVGDGHGLSGTMAGAWSLQSDMSNAQGFSYGDGEWGPEDFDAQPSGQGYYSFFPKGQFQAGATIYFQATITSSAGSSKSSIGSCTAL